MMCVQNKNKIIMFSNVSKRVSRHCDFPSPPLVCSLANNNIHFQKKNWYNRDSFYYACIIADY